MDGAAVGELIAMGRKPWSPRRPGERAGSDRTLVPGEARFRRRNAVRLLIGWMMLARKTYGSVSRADCPGPRRCADPRRRDGRLGYAGAKAVRSVKVAASALGRAFLKGVMWEKRRVSAIKPVRSTEIATETRSAR